MRQVECERAVRRSDRSALPTSNRRTVELFGLDVDALTMEETIERVRDLTSAGEPVQHVVINAGKVVACADDRRLRDVIRSCPLVNADGASVVWAARLLGRPLPERVAGIDLFTRLLGVAELDGLSVFLLGARESVLVELAAVLRERHPRLRVAGMRNGYWDDDAAVVGEVRESGADMLFVAIPSPRKEFWLAEHLADLGVPFAMGVGGSFDVLAGVVRRAPVLMQRLGLEWAYRLAQEPRRMWKRYLVGNSRFVWLTLEEFWTQRRSSTSRPLDRTTNARYQR